MPDSIWTGLQKTAWLAKMLRQLILPALLNPIVDIIYPTGNLLQKLYCSFWFLHS